MHTGFIIINTACSTCIPPDYKIVIICSNEEEKKSHVISKLQFYRRPYSAMQSNFEFEEYFMRHFKKWPKTATSMVPGSAVVASAVDPDK